MVITIPFKILAIDGEGYHLLVKVSVNGKTAKLIIDTGASKTVFDTTRVAKYIKDTNFGTHDKLSTGLGTSSMKSYSTILKKIRIGTLEIKNYNAVLIDLSHVNNSYGQVGIEPVEGVLGSDILVQYKAVIDYEKKVLKMKYKKR